MVSRALIDCQPENHQCENHENHQSVIYPEVINPEVINHEDFAVGRFIRFLKHIHLKEHLSKISDPRQSGKIKYSNFTLLLWALSVFIFRQESKNALHTTIESLPTNKKVSLLNFFEIDIGSIPHRSTVDDYLATLEVDEINQLLMDLFKECMKNKLFYNHAEHLLPNNQFHIGTDGFWVHKYDLPHAVDKHGNNICPYCLSRTTNKGKENEKTYWVHAFVTFIFIFPGGFTLPIYAYPLKAEQVNTSKNDEDLKQECELTAFYAILPELRQSLGRIPITMLMDSLYANEPVIKLIESLPNMKYFIVRKEDSLKHVGRKCDELEKTELYQKCYQKKRIVKLKNGGSLEQSIKWFNRVEVGKESYTNVIRFEEIKKNEHGEVKDTYKNEWLSEEKINSENCFNLAERARMRFGGHEDTHNTMKMRGFAAEHDYARSDFRKMTAWKSLMFVAYFVMELFSFTSLGMEAKGKRSWMKFAKDLLQQLVEVPWNLINMSMSLQKQRIQFRYMFGVPDN